MSESANTSPTETPAAPAIGEVNKEIVVRPGENPSDEIWEATEPPIIEQRMREVTESTTDKAEKVKKALEGQDEGEEEQADSEEDDVEESGEEDSDSEEESEEESEESDDDEEEKAESEEEDEEKQIKKDAKKARYFEVKDLDGKTVRISNDQKIIVKGDGSKDEVTIGELKEDYAGRKWFSRTKSELETEKHQFQQDRHQVEDLIDDFYTHAEKKNYIGAMSVLTEKAGMDVPSFLGSFIDSIYAAGQKMAQLTPEQVALEKTQMINDYYQQSQVKQQKQADQARQAQSEQEEINKVLEKTGATKEDLVKILDEVTAQGNPNVTLEQLGHEFLRRKTSGRAEAVVQKIDPELIKDQKLIEDLGKAAEMYPDLTDDDLVDIAKRALGRTEEKKTETVKKQKAKNLSRKARKSQPEKIKKQTTGSVKAGNSGEPLTFDDL